MSNNITIISVIKEKTIDFILNCNLYKKQIFNNS